MISGCPLSVCGRFLLLLISIERYIFSLCAADCPMKRSVWDVGCWGEVAQCDESDEFSGKAREIFERQKNKELSRMLNSFLSISRGDWIRTSDNTPPRRVL